MSEFRNYVAVVEVDIFGRYFASIPDFPKVSASAITVDDALKTLALHADDYVAKCSKAEQEVPTPSTWDEVDISGKDPKTMRAWIPVRFPPETPRTVKISISIDEFLLDRIDRAARLRGETRSGFIAAAAGDSAREILKTPELTQEEMVRVIEQAGGLRKVLEGLGSKPA